MKFKVGDKIKNKEYGLGKIVYINEKLEELGEYRPMQFNLKYLIKICII